MERHLWFALLAVLSACGPNAWVPADADLGDGGLEDTGGDAGSDAEAPVDGSTDGDVGDVGEVEDAGPDGDADTDVDADGDAGEDADEEPLDPCEPIAGASYTTLSREGAPTDRPAPDHGDLNMRLRGWEPTGGTLGIIDIPPSPDDDPGAPQLYALFTDDRTPVFSSNYSVYEWDWSCDCRGALNDDYDVTVAGLATVRGEVLEVPDGGYDIGGGYEVLVLYVDDVSITLKYTREDNVVYGYTVHLEGVCVDPDLFALYRECDERYPFGDPRHRETLPALRGNQPFGRARGEEVRVAIRDTGRYMDPRARKDWWIGR